ncbi:MAG: substrate-binding domain-containing protein [Clostridia bacterium]|nr:substrate-binding domain-containing protein [Clostridia bacterium]
MKKAKGLLCSVLALGCAFGTAACGGAEKNITVVARTNGSGTRAAFEELVKDENGNALGGKRDGKEYSDVTKTALEKSETGDVKTAVASDKNAIGYVSLSALDSTVKAVSVNGFAPTTENVLAGDYQLQRPFVIMTNATVELTPLAADFMNYLYSAEMQAHVEAAGCVWTEDGAKRANAGESPIEVIEWQEQAALPSAGASGKIVVNGSTSMQKLIEKAAAGYAEAYGVLATDIFTIELQSSSVGRKGAEDDATGSFIGLSSAAVVNNPKVKAFNVCFDAIAVIVNPANEAINDLTVTQLYGIYTGKITKFGELQ